MHSHSSIRPPIEGIRSDRTDAWMALYAHLVDSAGRIRRLTTPAAESVGLREVEFRLMTMLAWDDQSGIGQRELARRLGVSDAQVSGLVERLRRCDLLAASRCRKDRRRQLWRLTEPGRRLLDDATEQFDRHLAPVAEQPDPSTVRELDDRLRHLIQAIDRPKAPLRRFDPDANDDPTAGQPTTPHQEAPHGKEARR